MHLPPIVTPADWQTVRDELMAEEKEATRALDALAAKRRRLPMVRIDKEYVFEGPDGPATLADLFEGRSQLVVYHFMFNPETDVGCPHCSFWADNFNGVVAHLNHRDVTFVAISRAPVAKLQAFEKRMGWSFKWMSSGGTDFNYDFCVSFTPEQIRNGAVFYNYQKVDMDMADREGTSVFYKDAGGAVFHTYSAYARGIDLLNTAYNYLDLVPKGRDEDDLEFTQSWVRHHDQYDK